MIVGGLASTLCGGTITSFTLGVIAILIGAGLIVIDKKVMKNG